MDKKWRDSLQILFGLGLAFLFFYMLAPFLVATLIGSVVAIITFPIFRELNKSMPSSLSAGLVAFGLTIGILLPIVFVLYTGSFKILSVVNTLEFLKEDAVGEGIVEVLWIENILQTLQSWIPSEKEWVREQGLIAIQNFAHKISALVGQSLSQMPTILVGFFVVILSVYFLLKDGALFLKFLSRLSPLPSEKTQQLYQTFEQSCRGVVAGAFLSALAQGILMTVLFYFTGLPSPILSGTLSIGMGMVPIVGTSPIWGGAIVYFLSIGSTTGAIVMLVGGILISITDQWVRAMVIQDQNNMHPFLVMISIFGAVNFIGAAGIFLGPIIAAVFVAFLNIVSAEFRGEKSLIKSELAPKVET